MLVTAAEVDCAALLGNETEHLVAAGLVLAGTAYQFDCGLGPEVETTRYGAIIDGHLGVEAVTVEEARVLDPVRDCHRRGPAIPRLVVARD